MICLANWVWEGRNSLKRIMNLKKKKKEWDLSMRLIPLSRGADIFLEECWMPESVLKDSVK